MQDIETKKAQKQINKTLKTLETLNLTRLW